MSEKIEHRICLVCEQEKRTTVRKEEKEDYICEECLRGNIYDEAVKGLKGMKGFIIITIVGVIAFLIGYLV